MATATAACNPTYRLFSGLTKAEAEKRARAVETQERKLRKFGGSGNYAAVRVVKTFEGPGRASDRYAVEVDKLQLDNPAKFDKCVREVQASLQKHGQTGNAYAICTAALSKRNPYNHPDFWEHVYSWAITEQQADAIAREANRSGATRRGKFVAGSFKVEHPEGHTWAVTGVLTGNKPGKRRNPESAAADLSEQFHGRAGNEIIEVEEQVHYHENLANLAELVELTIDTPSGYTCTLQFESPRPYLAASEDKTSFYIVGGDQTVDLDALHMDDDKWRKDLMVLGDVKELVYYTAKEQDEFQGSEYVHKSLEGLSADGTKHVQLDGTDMILLYDTRSQLLSFAGGIANLMDPEVGIVG